MFLRDREVDMLESRMTSYSCLLIYRGRKEKGRKKREKMMGRGGSHDILNNLC